jgi:hypothetical protein
LVGFAPRYSAKLRTTRHSGESRIPAFEADMRFFYALNRTDSHNLAKQYVAVNAAHQLLEVDVRFFRALICSTARDSALVYYTAKFH